MNEGKITETDCSQLTTQTSVVTCEVFLGRELQGLLWQTRLRNSHGNTIKG